MHGIEDSLQILIAVANVFFVVLAPFLASYLNNIKKSLSNISEHTTQLAVIEKEMDNIKTDVNEIKLEVRVMQTDVNGIKIRTERIK